MSDGAYVCLVLTIIKQAHSILNLLLGIVKRIFQLCKLTKICNAIDAYKNAYSAAKYLDETDSTDQESPGGPDTSESKLSLCQRIMQTGMYIGQYAVRVLSIVSMILLTISTLVIESCLGLFSI